MTFKEILDQAIALLQRRGRLTYRALKRQFNLDDDYLEDVKAELIKGERLAVDEDGEVLVWTGGTAVSPRTIPPAPQPGAPPGSADAPPPPSPSVAAAPPSPEAERRQLTVLFCDLVDSTALSSCLDPEDLRTVVRAYQAACVEVVQRFDGHIAQYLGDGLLVYFGYLRAHEDTVQRAVRSGLGMIAAVRTLNTCLEREYGVRLAVRLGIHTELVVVGEVGSGRRQEQLALGETPNIAARLQGLAAPDTVVISAATAQLIHGYFVCQPLGAPALKGVPQPFQVYQVLHESGAQSRLDVATVRGLTPLIDREEEVLLLQRRWKQASTGLGQVVLLSGEAGIGKSRLAQVLKEHITAAPHTRIEWRRSPYHQQSALYPLIDHLQRLLRGNHDTPSAEQLRTLEAALTTSGMALAEAVPLLAALLSLPLLASGLLEEQEDRYALHGPLPPPLTIPATLHDALMARMDRLAAAKVVAQLGATIGRTFAYDVVQAVASLDEETLQGALAQLVEAESVAQRGRPPQATYTFKHALIQDAAYESLLRSTRQQYHQHIAQVCWPSAAPTPPSRSPKCWRSTTPLPACMPRHYPIGSEPGNAPSSARRIARLWRPWSGGWTLWPICRKRALPWSRPLISGSPCDRLRSALQWSADWGRILAYRREAESLASTLDDPHRLARVSGFLSVHFRRMGTYDQAIATAQRVLVLATASGDALLHALANHYTIGMTFWLPQTEAALVGVG